MNALVLNGHGAEPSKERRGRGPEKARILSVFQVTLVTSAKTFTSHGATVLEPGKDCEREIANISKCATIGTVLESFKRPTEQGIHGPAWFFSGAPQQRTHSGACSQGGEDPPPGLRSPVAPKKAAERPIPIP